jgi:hypothetical protein
LSRVDGPGQSAAAAYGRGTRHPAPVGTLILLVTAAGRAAEGKVRFQALATNLNPGVHSVPEPAAMARVTAQYEGWMAAASSRSRTVT